MLVDLTVKEFLNKVAGSDPVPGGGSIAALNGAVASALAAMVANLTIGKKGYEEHEELMKHISEVALQVKDTFIGDIDRDSEAYDSVFACFKMPKATDEEKAASSDSIVSSNGQEDHVSMGANAATKLFRIMDNLEHILAIELMNAAQGIDFRRPQKTSPILERFLCEYRKEVPFVKDDIVMYKEIHKTVAFLSRTKFDY